jgi:cytochrome b
MVYPIWATPGAVVATGIAMAGLLTTSVSAGHENVAIVERSHREDGDDDAGATEGGTGEGDALGEIHEGAVNLLYVLITLHIGGVLFESRRSGRNLAGEMLPGPR